MSVENIFSNLPACLSTDSDGIERLNTAFSVVASLVDRYRDLAIELLQNGELVLDPHDGRTPTGMQKIIDMADGGRAVATFCPSFPSDNKHEQSIYGLSFTHYNQRGNKNLFVCNLIADNGPVTDRYMRPNTIIHMSPSAIVTVAPTNPYNLQRLLTSAINACQHTGQADFVTLAKNIRSALEGLRSCPQGGN